MREWAKFPHVRKEREEKRRRPTSGPTTSGARGRRVGEGPALLALGAQRRRAGPTCARVHRRDASTSSSTWTAPTSPAAAATPSASSRRIARRAGGGAAIVLDAEQIEVTALCGVPVPEDRRRLNNNLEERWEKFIVRVQTDVVNGDVERLYQRLEWNQQREEPEQRGLRPDVRRLARQKVAHIIAAINELVSVSPSPPPSASPSPPSASPPRGRRRRHRPSPSPPPPSASSPAPRTGPNAETKPASMLRLP